MSKSVDHELNSTMALTRTSSKVPKSFVYEDLIFHIQTMQHQMNAMTKFLDDQCKNDKQLRKELKSHSLKFIDPYGNLTTHECFDYEMINTIFNKYKKDYVPKYLQKWIKIGKINQNIISPFEDHELTLSVSNYTDDYQFITYGELNISIAYGEKAPLQNLLLRVLLTDSIEKIKMLIQELKKIKNLELKSCILNQHGLSNEQCWSQSQLLNLNDTVLSRKLYEGNCGIMATLLEEKVDNQRFSSGYRLFVKTNRGTLFDISVFRFKNTKHLERFPMIQLQHAILEGHALLSQLFSDVQNYRVSSDVPNLKNIILPNVTDDQDEDSDDFSDDE
ncbi:unnamed protein product [Rotaria magnacalcarata]|uniref:Uncharacterized protein n=1 Tax=Rotaria magnacalcarata TaxID=392030 RepID=A0A819VCA1_9BILA|nr:unnamed protein product [Rotaria magnacalcarata]